MTTKDQERKALAQIRKIVEGLGEGSYIGMAFEGCFEIAADNIENDFGCSMKQRAESAQREADSLREQLRKAKEETQIIEDSRMCFMKEVQKLQRATLSPDDMTDCIDLLADTIFTKDQEANAALQEIVRLEDHPEAPEFAQAVRDNRNAIGKARYYEELRERIRNARAAL